ncbi:hypothetical protein GCM10011571_21230 [Marinithermofilum abyssi]|uniref:Uncharacterized protein n=1 Tax=Marinithermofilum abyssi TaxID=1571185 RepID=A0A8J2VIW0_9BACL|nr:hypothetical protein [Marinithermofilum abyssi]GGE19063.1 hypothetical protein GCM10011571_21230 [Marinithermofilum abyssi]
MKEPVYMKWFPHGNVVNFQASVREMTPPELEQLLRRVIGQKVPVLTGTLDWVRQELYLYGQALEVKTEAFEGTWLIKSQADDGSEHVHTYSLDELKLSHEAHFDIEDAAAGLIRYSVYYVTFGPEEGKSGEITLFFADQRAENPLDCVVEFWEQAKDVGRDTQFTSACGLPPGFKELLKGEKKPS